jgi:aldehyde dehydrogenase (NAD+)
LSRAHKMARSLKAGTVWVNCFNQLDPITPFGGYKQSGFGRELSIDTLELYLETKGVLFSTGPKPFNPFGL